MTTFYSAKGDYDDTDELVLLDTIVAYGSLVELNGGGEAIGC